MEEKARPPPNSSVRPISINFSFVMLIPGPLCGPGFHFARCCVILNMVKFLEGNLEYVG